MANALRVRFWNDKEILNMILLYVAQSNTKKHQEKNFEKHSV